MRRPKLTAMEWSLIWEALQASIERFRADAQEIERTCGSASDMPPAAELKRLKADLMQGLKDKLA